MNFDPEKLFIGLAEFFTILLPGAALALVFGAGVSTWTGTFGVAMSGGAPQLALFLFFSYVLGHIVFMVSALLDIPYEWVREKVRKARPDQADDEEGGSGRSCLRWLRVVFKPEHDASFDAALELLRSLPIHHGKNYDKKRVDGMNPYQWSKIVLSEKHPKSMTPVQRFEADSKFFRSFSIVLVLYVPVFYGLGSSLADSIVHVLAGLVFVVMSLARYADQRRKATAQACMAIIALQNELGIAPAQRQRAA